MAPTSPRGAAPAPAHAPESRPVPSQAGDLAPTRSPDADEPAPPAQAPLEIFEPLCAVFRRTLRAEGLKYTPERAHVLDMIVRMPGPFEADRVVREMRDAGFRVSKATIYRTLQLLMQAGIIQRVLVTEERSYFQLTYGTQATDLIVRTDTGELITIAAPELVALRNRLCAQHGLVAQGHRFHIFASAGGERSGSGEGGRKA